MRTVIRRRMAATSTAETGTATTKTGRNSGTRTAVMTIAPASVVIAAMPESNVCRVLSTTFSTSRTILACSTPALIRRW